MTTTLFPKPAPSMEGALVRQHHRKQASLRAEIEDIESQIAWLQDDLKSARKRLDELERVEVVWPDKATLLAVYGAPGNWPVEPA